MALTEINTIYKKLRKLQKVKKDAMQYKCNIDDVAAQLSIDVLNKLGFGGIKLKDTKAALKTLEKD